MSGKARKSLGRAWEKLGKGCAAAALQLRYGCAAAALRWDAFIRVGPEAALRLRCSCAAAALQLLYGCAAAALRLRCSSYC
eukprot:gene17274-biopygen4680